MGCGSSASRPSEPAAPPDPPTAAPTASKLTEEGHDHVVIKFYRMGDPTLGLVHEAFCQMANEYPTILFMEAEADENYEAVMELEVESLPTFVAFQKHTEVGRFVGSDVAGIRSFVAGLGPCPCMRPAPVDGADIPATEPAAAAVLPAAAPAAAPTAAEPASPANASGEPASAEVKPAEANPEEAKPADAPAKPAPAAAPPAAPTALPKRGSAPPRSRGPRSARGGRGGRPRRP